MMPTERLMLTNQLAIMEAIFAVLPAALATRSLSHQITVTSEVLQNPEMKEAHKRLLKELTK